MSAAIKISDSVSYAIVLMPILMSMQQEAVLNDATTDVCVQRCINVLLSQECWEVASHLCLHCLRASQWKPVTLETQVSADSSSIVAPFCKDPIICHSMSPPLPPPPASQPNSHPTTFVPSAFGVLVQQIGTAPSYCHQALLNLGGMVWLARFPLEVCASVPLSLRVSPQWHSPLPLHAQHAALSAPTTKCLCLSSQNPDRGREGCHCLCSVIQGCVSTEIGICASLTHTHHPDYSSCFEKSNWVCRWYYTLHQILLAGRWGMDIAKDSGGGRGGGGSGLPSILASCCHVVPLSCCSPALSKAELVCVGSTWTVFVHQVVPALHLVYTHTHTWSGMCIWLLPAERDYEVVLCLEKVERILIH